jgi:hypothetical protein
MAAPGVPSLRLAPLRTRALDGTLRNLPQELPGERTLVVLAYRQRHQRDVDAWIALAVAHGVPATHRGAREPLASAVVEVPFLSGRWLPVRRLIDGGMAQGIGDPDVLARTLTAYGSPARHRRACGLLAIDGSRADGSPADGREVQALVAERDGRVHWHASGPPERADAVTIAALGGALRVG